MGLVNGCEVCIIYSMKKTSFLDVSTSRSLKSEVDLFSKFEVNFLEKYMKCILTDNFGKWFLNIHEEYFFRKAADKVTRLVGGSFFQVREDFTIEQLLEELTLYFRDKSAAVKEGEFPQPLKLVHTTTKPHKGIIKAGDLLFVDVKIRVEVARIEEIPGNIQATLSKYFSEPLKNHDKRMQETLLTQKSEYLNILVFYYGDIHFNFNRPQYLLKTLKLGGKEFKVRMFVIYTSKLAMFETFKTTNNVNVECINDLVISFFDIRREKKLIARQKKRDSKNSNEMSEIGSHRSKGVNLSLILGAGGAICLGLLLVKLFS